MKQLLAFVRAYFGIKAFEKKDGKSILTKDQREKLASEFSEEYAAQIEGALNSETAEDDPAMIEAAQTMISGLQTRLTAAEAERTRLEGLTNASAATIADNDRTIAALNGTLGILRLQGENNPAPVKPTLKAGELDPTNDKFLFGINNPLFAIDEKHRYNQRAYAAILEMNGHGTMMMVPKASSLDYASLSSDLGDYYRIRKQEQIQSFLATLPSLEAIFPLESGYQDQAVLVNMFMDGDFSQAGNQTSTFDNVVKGAYKFEPEVLTMYDVMFAHKFTDLKAIEKQWIGYLNREGSSSMKWSFIQYLLVETGKKLHNEREQRRIKGKRISPIANTPGTAMGASDGLYTFIKKQIELFKIKTFATAAPTDSNIAGILYTMAGLIPAEIRDSGKLECHLPSILITYYHKNLETLYGSNMDYQKNMMYIKEFPSVKLVAIPNADMFGRIIFTLAGNIRLFENTAGEMLNFQLEQQDWGLKVWSEWKEGLHAMLVGKKFANAAAQDYDHQLIWCNDQHYSSTYYLTIPADDTTPSVAEHTMLITPANTVATAITDFDDAVVGTPFTVKCGNATNASTIAAAGDFSIITAAWTPAVGDTITLMKRADGKFIELSRTDADAPTAFAADDTTPSVAGGTIFITDANSQATAITTFDGATAGIVYTIHGAGAANASTMANAGNLVLTAAMTLSAGTFIKVVKAENGKFYETARG